MLLSKPTWVTCGCESGRSVGGCESVCVVVVVCEGWVKVCVCRASGLLGWGGGRKWGGGCLLEGVKVMGVVGG